MSGPSFRFSLERVRALRERTEDEAKQALAGALRDELRSEHNVERAAQAMQAARDSQSVLGNAPVGAEMLVARQAYLERSEQAHRASVEMLKHSRRHVAQRRLALTEAARDRQALERLKETRRLDHERELQRLENIELDEIALNGFRRKAAA